MATSLLAALRGGMLRLRHHDVLRQRRFAAAACEGIVIVQDGRIIDVNHAAIALLGRSPDELVGQPVLNLIAAGHVEAAHQLLARAGTGRTPTPFELDLRGGPAGTIPVELRARNVQQGRHSALVLTLRDLSDRRSAEAQLRHLAEHDPQTGLPNRACFVQRLSAALAAGAPSLAVLYLDLDRFKSINDTHGHGAGDRLLHEVAARLAAAIRRSDLCARLGGDEFAILLAATPADARQAAGETAARILDALAHPLLIAGQAIEIGASIGISVHPEHGGDAEQLLGAAETAMHRAKYDGRNQHCVYVPGMDRFDRDRRSLEPDLRHAIARGEMELYYQPLVHCGGGGIEGFEALLRWTHPTRGSVSPVDFIPAAEAAGLIGAIGHWVLETACAEAASWPGEYRIAVNLSPLQFRLPNLPGMVADVLARTGLAPHRLELEVTEGVLIDDSARALSVLNALRALGARISLDDFGTGYSSLNYLSRFPFDKVKIDKSFVQASCERPEAATIVQAMVSLGRNLHLAVTAEGVETQAQWDMLRHQECHQVQGYLLGRPMPQRALGALLAPRPGLRLVAAA